MEEGGGRSKEGGGGQVKVGLSGRFRREGRGPLISPFSIKNITRAFPAGRSKNKRHKMKRRSGQPKVPTYLGRQETARDKPGRRFGRLRSR